MGELKTVKDIYCQCTGSWEKIFPGYPFDYHFMDQAVESIYENEKATKTPIQLFAIMAIFIACIGLFGLAGGLFSDEGLAAKLCLSN